jgi:peptidoglycan/LPS O-acetylase OafA/YrhL
MPGVDGLRALAVAAVFAYHGGLSWLPGGFLGVDVFLVISGYLITSLLLVELQVTGKIDLPRFWLRRARRLLPAVLVMIVVVLAVMSLLHPDEVGALRGAVVASLFYVTNWYLIFAKQSYFAQFARPSVFQHLWSLAVEEQFYLLWPPILAAGMLWFGKRRLVYGVLVGLAASTILAWVLYQPFTDPSRIYYGTDTRAAGLLVGVLMAFAWPATRLAPTRNRRAAVLLDVLGVAALAALIGLMMWLGELDRWLYQGGFLTVALVTAVLLAVVAHPSSQLGRAFALPLFVWIGKRSYGIYLWHWPVLELTRAHTDVPFGGPPLLVMQVAVTVGIAELSYRYIEIPIRVHGLRGIRDQLFIPGEAGRRRRMATFAAGAATVVLAVFVVLVPAHTPTLKVVPASAGKGVFAGTTVGSHLTAAETKRRFQAAVAEGPVVAVGDSVMLGAAPALQTVFGRHLIVNAVEGRQFSSAVPLVAEYEQRLHPKLVIIQLGNNGYIPFDQLQSMLATLRPVHTVVLVNLHVDKPWQDSVNSALAYAAQTHPNVVVANWNAAAGGHGTFFYDGTHVNPAGAHLYATVLVAAIAKRGP